MNRKNRYVKGRRRSTFKLKKLNRAFILRISTESALSAFYGVPVRSFQPPYSGTRFTHRCGEEMHEKNLSKDSKSTWHNQDSNPGSPDPVAKCLPLDHNACQRECHTHACACSNTFLKQDDLLLNKYKIWIAL